MCIEHACTHRIAVVDLSMVTQGSWKQGWNRKAWLQNANDLRAGRPSTGLSWSGLGPIKLVPVRPGLKVMPCLGVLVLPGNLKLYDNIM